MVASENIIKEWFPFYSVKLNRHWIIHTFQ